MKTQAHKLDVEINHMVKVLENGLTVLKIEAACGDTKHIHSITVGAVDGARKTPPTKEELQKMLDDGRQYAAGEAAWKESVKTASASLV